MIAGAVLRENVWNGLDPPGRVYLSDTGIRCEWRCPFVIKWSLKNWGLCRPLTLAYNIGMELILRMETFSE